MCSTGWVTAPNRSTKPIRKLVIPGSDLIIFKALATVWLIIPITDKYFSSDLVLELIIPMSLQVLINSSSPRRHWHQVREVARTPGECLEHLHFLLEKGREENNSWKSSLNTKANANYTPSMISSSCIGNSLIQPLDLIHLHNKWVITLKDRTVPFSLL